MGVIARQSIKGAIANYLGVAIGFFTTFVVLTRCLTSEEVGFTRVLVDAAMLFSSLAQLGTNASIIRFFPFFKDNDKNHGIFGWSLLLPAVGFAIFGLFFLLFREPLTALYAEKSPLMADYMYVLPMITFFALYMTVFETNASVLLRITVPKMVREVGIRVFNLVAYLMYGAGWIPFEVFVWLFCGSYGLAMVLNLLYLLSLGKVSFRIDRHFLDRRKVGEILRYTLFMTATVLAGNVQLLGSLFLGAKVGAAMTGVYAIAMYIANVVEVPYRSLGAISQPVISAAVKEGDWGEVNRLSQQVSLHQMLVSSLIFFLIWINLDALFYLLPNGAEYAGGRVVVLLLGLAKIVNSSFSIGTNVLNFSKHYAWSLFFIGVLTVSVLWLNGCMIDWWDIDGAAASVLTSYGVYFALLLGFLYRRLRVSLFSKGQLKVLAIVGVMFVLEWVWNQYLGGLFEGRVLLESVAKTAVLGGASLVAVYAWEVSPTVNAMCRKIIKKR